MVDIHSHILPGLDDGSRSLEESLAMLRVAAENGTTDIVATPHANLEYKFDADRVAVSIAQLSAACGPMPRIHGGCDFHLSYENVQDALAHPRRYTINHQNYLLVEFSDLLIFRNTGEIFDRLIEAGMIPVITHPERNWLLHERTRDLRAWAAKGCLLQITASSFLGRWGRAATHFSDTLMRLGLVHFVASDAHDPEDRTPDLSGAWTHVAHNYGEERAQRLFVSNPKCALAGEPVNPEPAPQPPSPRRWFHFWR